MKITIVGGGFGGVKAALELAKEKKNHITLISDKTDFQYYPGLYGTATGKSHLQSWVPLGEIFAGHDNILVVIDSVTKINKKEKTLKGESGAVYHYTTLILALGSATTYYGIKGLDQYAYGIKSAAEIKRLKQHIFDEFSQPQSSDANFLIVGAGPTGIELASSLGTYLHKLKKHLGRHDQNIKITVIEAAPRVLPHMSEKASKLVHARLKKLGVHVELNKKVEEQTVDTLIVSGEPIKSQTVIWTSGVVNNTFFEANADQFTFSRNKKIVVDENLRESEHVYVIGDNAFTPFSGLAQTALKDGIFVAAHLMGSKKKYIAKMPPIVVPVGENWALFEYKKILMTGTPASMIRSVADFVGYSDLLPFGQALGVWRAQKVWEDDYFPIGK
ncbi:FAD-dependent oxidoreductase [Candidatus Saccharibacteria bacterium]|nr:FAD-dependent oxidoreductase [Candidatus Saccharibacteria bacterium]